MSIGIGKDYSQFYRGTEALPVYGSDAQTAKESGLPCYDTIVRYEFNTTDEHGNKIMDKMTREETLQAMKEVSAQYGDNVMVMFSGDGMAALVEAKKGQLDRPLTEEEIADRAKRQELLDNSIVQMHANRLFIPNIQTNDKLVKGLEGTDESVVDAAYGIIRNYMLKSDAADMSERQRQDMIAFGMEEARYLAKNYMDEVHSSLFLDAMETIAKYGMNGTVSEDGRMVYSIEKGPLVGAPDNYVHANDIIKEKAPELYRQQQELNRRIAKGETGWGREFIELQKKVNAFLNADSGQKRSDGSKLTVAEAEAGKYSGWKKKITDTKLPETFKGVRYDDLNAFFESLQGQGSLSNDWIAAGRDRMTKWLSAPADK